MQGPRIRVRYHRLQGRYFKDASPTPSGIGSTAWKVVLPRSSRVSRAPPYSRIMPVLPIRGYHPLRPSFPERSSYINTITGLVRVRSPLLTESQLMSFPPGTEMFQFSGFAPSRVTLQCRVSPFGNLRIKGCLHLPTAYRSMPRPSSPLVAKASTRCS